MKHDPSLGSFRDVGFPGMSTDPGLDIGRSLGVPSLGTSPGLGTARPRSLLRRHRGAPATLNLTRRDILPTLTGTLTTIALGVGMIASPLAAQDSGSRAELENPIGAAKTDPPPHGLVTPAHVEWDWHRTVGIDINDKIAYRLDITVGANGTGEATAGTDVTQPSNFPPITVR